MSEQQIVLLLQNDKHTEITSRELELRSLPHPKYTNSSKDIERVIFIHLNGELYELQSVQWRNHGSWFINQRVSSRKKLYLASKIDPRFFILPYFERSLNNECQGKFCPLNQIITPYNVEDRFPLTNISQWKLDEICDVNDRFGDDMILYRYNLEKTLSWLKGKVHRTSLTLLKQRISKESAANPLFVSHFNLSAPISSNNSTIEEKVIEAEPSKADIATAIEIVSSYLTDETAGKLHALFEADLAGHSSFSEKASSEGSNQKRKADWELELEVPSKRQIIPSLIYLNNNIPSWRKRRWLSLPWLRIATSNRNQRLRHLSSQQRR